MFIDDLAQEIRRVDGAHQLGAGRLAEALAPFIYNLVDHYTDVACDLILGDNEEDPDINANDVASGLLLATAQAHREIHAGVCIDVEQPCGHSDISEGCPRHDPRSEGECPSCGGVLYECGGDFLLCDECGDEWDPDIIADVEDL